MKLSDMSFDDMINVVSTIAVEIEPLFDDEVVMGLSVDLKPGENETNLDYGRRVSKKLIELLTLVSVKYSSAFRNILAAYFQCSAEEVGGKSVKEIIALVKDSINDEVLHGFFPRLKVWVQSEPLNTSPVREDFQQKEPLFALWRNSKMNKSV